MPDLKGIPRPDGYTQACRSDCVPAGEWSVGAVTLSSTAVVPLSTLTTECWAGVTLQASTANTVNVVIGATTGVTPATGYPLQPGREVHLYAPKISQVYLVQSSTSANQIVYFLQQ